MSVAGLLVSAVLVQGASQPDSLARARITVLPVVSYSDVTGLQYGATVFRSLRNPADSSTRPSTLSLYAAWTAKDHVKWYVQSDIWSPGNSRRWRSRIEYISYPLPYYGIGGSAPDGAEEWYSSGVTTVHIVTQRALRPSTYLHAGGRYVRSQLREWEVGGLLEQVPQAGGPGVTLTSAELGLVVDSRDNLVLPRAGTYARIIPSIASRAFGSDFVVRRLTIDARRYGALGRLTTAAQLQFDGIGGTAPFDQMPMIGADSAMRGYPRGRYRDRHALTGQLEIRSPRWRRVGAVVFAGAGTVARSFSTLGSETWFPTGGVGLRYVLLPKDRTVARVDLGIGRGSFGLNLGIGEAF